MELSEFWRRRVVVALEECCPGAVFTETEINDLAFKFAVDAPDMIKQLLAENSSLRKELGAQQSEAMQREEMIAKLLKSPSHETHHRLHGCG